MVSKRLAFTRAHNLSKLHDELIAAGLRPERVEGRASDIWLTVGDDADEKAIAAIVAAHDPAPRPPKPTAGEVAAGIIEKAGTLAEVKATLAAWLRAQK